MKNNIMRPAILVLENGIIIQGIGFGSFGEAVGELCFNTGMTGYQESLSDPSYASQIIVFTSAHIGNVGCNDEDQESIRPQSLGCVLNNHPTEASNYRSQICFDDWLKKYNLIGICGPDTRDLTSLLRQKGALKAGLHHNKDIVDKNDASLDIIAKDLLQKVRSWPGLEGQDIASKVSLVNAERKKSASSSKAKLRNSTNNYSKLHIVIIDYGMKQSIANIITNLGAKITIVSSSTSFTEIKSLSPHGVLLSNGPGDPYATYKNVGSTIRKLLTNKTPCMGVCLGFQLLCLALDAKSFKHKYGHHGLNHPVKCINDNSVLITSQNHGFSIDKKSLNKDCECTHYSLFDGTLEGFQNKKRKILGLQFHPEASPGPRESSKYFKDFFEWIS